MFRLPRLLGRIRIPLSSKFSASFSNVSGAKLLKQGRPLVPLASLASLAMTGGLLLGTGVALAEGPETISAADISVGVKSLSTSDLGDDKDLDSNADGERRAYNPETGEIDWDCPCLGGMAHGPCGEEFKEAFSCFVYSNSEVKGSECIPKFTLMQDCFKKYPEVYADFQGDQEDEIAAPESNQSVEIPVEEIKIEVVEETD